MFNGTLSSLPQVAATSRTRHAEIIRMSSSYKFLVDFRPKCYTQASPHRTGWAWLYGATKKKWKFIEVCMTNQRSWCSTKAATWKKNGEAKEDLKVCQRLHKHDADMQTLVSKTGWGCPYGHLWDWPYNLKVHPGLLFLRKAFPHIPWHSNVWAFRPSSIVYTNWYK